LTAGVLEGARPGMVLVDMSTVDPETTRSTGWRRAGRAGLEHSLRGALGSRQHRQAGQQHHVDGQRAGRSEAFVLGVRAGMEPPRLLEILRTRARRSYHFEKRFPNILARNFEPGFTVDLARKDLGLAVDMARSHDVRIRARALRASCGPRRGPLGHAKTKHRLSHTPTVK
jgi:3-hydroxyisobutyrate dehydrogenase-like beta-hydroxyacid dehydrogenase